MTEEPEFEETKARAERAEAILSAIAPLGRYAGLVQRAVSSDIKRRADRERVGYRWLYLAAGLDDIPLDHLTDDLIDERVTDPGMWSAITHVRHVLKKLDAEDLEMYQAAGHLSALTVSLFPHAGKGERQ